MVFKDKVVLVDRKNKFQGIKDKINAHINPVALHRAISVLVFDKDKLLLQKRSKIKKTWPLFWTNTCCSHPRENESFQKAAERRLFEEMGIKLKLKRKFKFIYQAKYNKKWGENEYDWVFVGKFKGKISPDSMEVEEYKWIALKNLKQDIKNNPKIYTPWFRIILESI